VSVQFSYVALCAP